MDVSSWFGSSDTADFTVDDDKPLRQFYPNQFYKICPSTSFNSTSSTSASISLGRAPICGDGSEFCFYFTRPPQRVLNDERILIELMGGGACWDANTCGQQSSYLYVNSESLDGALGRSCKEVQLGMSSEGKAANMLCASTSSSTADSSDGDSQQQPNSMFAKYNMIIIPYCTQDVHVGSNSVTYDDGSTVHHMGAQNVASVLNWMYRNFRNPRHVAVTGCSAGGTAVPIVQQLVHEHYNHFGNRDTQVNALADSPVYLTPTYFLESGLSNWNPQPILSKIGLPYDQYRTTEDYPTLMWDFILRKGDNLNRWGFVSHTSDPISLMYYQYMSGNEGDGRIRHWRERRELEDNNDDDGSNQDESQWYAELTKSVSYIEKRHPNFNSFWMDSEGHCTFGWYYAIQESDFDAFVVPIFKEDRLLTSTRPSVGAFLISLFLGVGLIGLLLSNKRRRSKLTDKETLVVGKDGLLENQASSAPSTDPSTSGPSLKWKHFMVACQDYRVTVGYTMSVTTYFWAMIIQQGFAHPINNPSLGPSAVTLSDWGINNPSLVVYKWQWFRLLTTNFLLSGVLTYALAIYYLWMRTRPLERRITFDFQSPWLFVTLAVLIATAVNAIYCLVPSMQGASCTALPLLIGLQAFHLTFYLKTFTRPFLSVAALFCDVLVVSVLFPFNSWIMMVTAMITGSLLARVARRLDRYLPGIYNAKKARTGTTETTNTDALGPSKSTATSANSQGIDDTDDVSMGYESMDGRREVLSDDHRRTQRKKLITRTAFCVILSVVVVVVVPLFITLVASPNEVHVEPFYTGCKLYYTDAIDDLYSSFGPSNDDQAGNGGRDRGRRQLSLGQRMSETALRWLGEGDENVDYQCAEFCVPHLVTPVFKAVTRRRGIPIYSGQCEEHGYTTKILDKTFSARTYSLDVELYT